MIIIYYYLFLSILLLSILIYYYLFLLSNIILSLSLCNHMEPHKTILNSGYCHCFPINLPFIGDFLRFGGFPMVLITSSLKPSIYNSLSHGFLHVPISFPHVFTFSWWLHQLLPVSIQKLPFLGFSHGFSHGFPIPGGSGQLRLPLERRHVARHEALRPGPRGQRHGGELDTAGRASGSGHQQGRGGGVGFNIGFIGLLYRLL